MADLHGQYHADIAPQGGLETPPFDAVLVQESEGLSALSTGSAPPCFAEEPLPRGLPLLHMPLRRRSVPVSWLLHITGPCHFLPPTRQGTRQVPPEGKSLQQFVVQNAEVHVLRWLAHRAARRAP